MLHRGKEERQMISGVLELGGGGTAPPADEKEGRQSEFSHKRDQLG